MSSSTEHIVVGCEDYRRELSPVYWNELFISSFYKELNKAFAENPGLLEQSKAWTEADYKAAYEDPDKRREMLFGKQAK